MDGQQSSELVQAALEPAAPVPGASPAAVTTLPGLVGPLGNQSVARMEAGPRTAPPPLDPPAPTDLALGRALADTVRSRSAPTVARVELPDIDEPPLAPAPAAPSSGGPIGSQLPGISDRIRQMAQESAAKARPQLEADIKLLEPSVAAINHRLIPGLSAGIQAAIAHADPHIIATNVMALGPLLAPQVTVAPRAVGARDMVMDQLRTAVGTLASMDSRSRRPSPIRRAPRRRRSRRSTRDRRG
jgi:hypothetical protein